MTDDPRRDAIAQAIRDAALDLGTDRIPDEGPVIVGDEWSPGRWVEKVTASPEDIADVVLAALDAARNPIADLNRLMVDTRAMYEQWREHLAQAIENERDRRGWFAVTHMTFTDAARIVRATPFPAHDHTGVPGIDPAATTDGEA